MLDETARLLEDQRESTTRARCWRTDAAPVSAHVLDEVVASGFMIGAVLDAAIGAITGAEHWERLTIPTYAALRPSRAWLTLVVAVPF